MAIKIGNPITLSTLEYKVRVPQLLAEIALSEKHNHLLKAVVATGRLLQALAERSLIVRDPETIEILMQMGLIHHVNTDETFDDI